VGEFYVEHEYWFAATQLILAMLGMGATLTGKDFRDVVREPLAVSLGTIVQIVAVPLTAFLFQPFQAAPPPIFLPSLPVVTAHFLSVLPPSPLSRA
jgi:BASS family bile acid:Na+ symporter